MLIRHVALVSQSAHVDLAAVARVAAALQKQATRDFGPVWGVQATVDAFGTLHDVPVDYWPIIVKDNIKQPGAAGVHSDQDGQPFALVETSEQWSLTASHECLEMLADPFGNRLVAGRSVMHGQGRVRYLVEVADPCESAQFAYTVNGVVVSDFITPAYYAPVGSQSRRYSYTGSVHHPRQVLAGGYVSWQDPVSNHWYQLVMEPTGPKYYDLGVISASRSIREAIDRIVSVRRAGQNVEQPTFAKEVTEQYEQHARAASSLAAKRESSIEAAIGAASGAVQAVVGTVSEPVTASASKVQA